MHLIFEHYGHQARLIKARFLDPGAIIANPYPDVKQQWVTIKAIKFLGPYARITTEVGNDLVDPEKEFILQID